ncbi:MAG: hypothetical protein ACI9N0_001175 [Ilumatobacter sp.]|jgi:hypothetical protein
MNDDFDDVLRARLRHSAPAASSDAQNVLGQLKPAMRHARIRRGVAIGTATLSLLGVGGVGFAAVTNSLSQKSSELDILIDGEPLPEPTSQISTTTPDTDQTADDRSREEQTNVVTAISSFPTTTMESADSTTTTVAAAASSPPTPTVASAGPTQQEPTDNPAPPGTNSVPATTTEQPVPATTTEQPAPATTTAPPTTQSTPAPQVQRTIQSDCGSITVAQSNDSVVLASTQPNQGFLTDIKKSGSDEVEVGFDNGDAECRIKVWIEAGELRTDVENEDDAEEDAKNEDGAEEAEEIDDN